MTKAPDRSLPALRGVRQAKWSREMISGTENLSRSELKDDINRGGRFIRYQYCISIGVMTFTRETAIYYVNSRRSVVVRGLPWTFLTLLVGWWGFPWGPIRTVQCLSKNLGGGRDLTQAIVEELV
jgi:hypothetical protein